MSKYWKYYENYTRYWDYYGDWLQQTDQVYPIGNGAMPSSYSTAWSSASSQLQGGSSRDSGSDGRSHNRRANQHYDYDHHKSYKNYTRNYSRDNNNRYTQRPAITSRRIIECYNCDKIFTSNELLHAHRAKEHNSYRRTYYCPICSKQFSSMQNMQEHKLTHPIFGCEHCPETFQFKESLDAHNKHAHPEGSSCADNGTSYEKLTAPIASSTPVSSFSNPAKREGNSQEDSGIDDKSSFSCPHCIKTFDSADKLLSHCKVHTEITTGSSSTHTVQPSPFVCPFCVKKFEQRRALHLHMSSIHTQIFYCPKCPAEFTDQALFDSHTC